MAAVPDSDQAGPVETGQVALGTNYRLRGHCKRASRSHVLHQEPPEIREGRLGLRSVGLVGDSRREGTEVAGFVVEGTVVAAVAAAIVVVVVVVVVAAAADMAVGRSVTVSTQIQPKIG